MAAKRWAGAGLAAAIVVVVVIGLTQAGGARKETGLALQAQLAGVAGSPSPLAELYEQANTVLPGGVTGIDRRVRALRGWPVVVNVWASWCPPCRAEIPAFQRVAARYGSRVAFLGVNSDEPQAAAERFLAQRPLVYPSYGDRDGRYASRVHVSLPSTLMYDKRGELVTLHQGSYESTEDLATDVRALLD